MQQRLARLVSVAVLQLRLDHVIREHPASYVD
jgi:hypothetical protein